MASLVMGVAGEGEESDRYSAAPDKPLTIKEIKRDDRPGCDPQCKPTLGVTNGFLGCTRTATFDRRAAELDEFELVPA